MITVLVSRVEGYEHVLLMHWERSPRPADVTAAFQTIVKHLDHATQPVNIIVNLLENPRIPALETARQALFGPQRHRNMGDWLVVGSSPLARLVESVMTTVSHNNIYWFDTMEDALKCAADLQEKTA